MPRQPRGRDRWARPEGHPGIQHWRTSCRRYARTPLAVSPLAPEAGSATSSKAYRSVVEAQGSEPMPCEDAAFGHVDGIGTQGDPRNRPLDIVAAEHPADPAIVCLDFLLTYIQQGLTRQLAMIEAHLAGHVLPEACLAGVGRIDDDDIELPLDDRLAEARRGVSCWCHPSIAARPTRHFRARESPCGQPERAGIRVPSCRCCP